MRGRERIMPTGSLVSTITRFGVEYTIHLNLAFTQQCLKSLESLGDSALATQNYSEAITHYSAALTMGPTAREGILVKRSNAHAAMGAWNDALNDADEVRSLLYLSCTSMR